MNKHTSLVAALLISGIGVNHVRADQTYTVTGYDPSFAWGSNAVTAFVMFGNSYYHCYGAEWTMQQSFSSLSAAAAAADAYWSVKGYGAWEAADGTTVY